MCFILMIVYIIVNRYNGKIVWIIYIGFGFYCEVFLIEECGIFLWGVKNRGGLVFFNIFLLLFFYYRWVL